MTKYEVKISRTDEVVSTVTVWLHAEDEDETEDIIFEDGSFDTIDAMFNGYYEGPLDYKVREGLSDERGLTITESIEEIEDE